MSPAPHSFLPLNKYEGIRGNKRRPTARGEISCVRGWGGEAGSCINLRTCVYLELLLESFLAFMHCICACNSPPCAVVCTCGMPLTP